eukprot:TRINITY_DN25211_c0_g1_i2.p1 TRINITY_DN25211_c0_g1~~TRINITY_DN25211_c0_g1_i2.p1  ORF type:complete len:213 (-),score=27.04 TRINITY_DN25211_c0_g1_i2:56-694(-)
MTNAAIAPTSVGLSFRRRGPADTEQNQLPAAVRQDADARKHFRLHLARENPEELFSRLNLGAGWPSADASRISISVHGHEEKDTHTYYQITCAVHSPGDMQRTLMSWRCEKRLCAIREELFDPVVEALGEGYEPVFYETPFALRGGLPGTTARLALWFERLAECMNTGKVPYELSAIFLHHLQAPVTGGDSIEPAAMPTLEAPPKPAQMAMM